MTSNKVLSADNQQERLRLPNPWYVTGFTDGEGSFHIAFYKDTQMKIGLKIIPEFHVSQNRSSRQVLEKLKEMFGCGNIKVNHRGKATDQTEVFVVRNRNDLLNKVIPFFEHYSLQTTKAKDFINFARVVRMMAKGLHQTDNGVKQIIFLAYQMNGNGKNRKKSKMDLLKIVKSSETIRGIPKKSGKI